MRKDLIDHQAGIIFQSLLCDLDEAELVSALAIAVTMRLAYQADSIGEVLEKLKNLSPIFMDYATINLGAFEEVRRAAEKARAEGTSA